LRREGRVFSAALYARVQPT